MNPKQKTRTHIYIFILFALSLLLFLFRSIWLPILWPQPDRTKLEKENFGFSAKAGEGFFYTPNIPGFFHGTNFSLSFYTIEGTVKMTQMYTMDAPIFEGEGNFLGVADTGGKDFYMFSPEKILYQHALEYPLVCFGINDAGFAVLVSFNGDSYKILVLDENGNIQSEGEIGHKEQFVVAADISADGRIFALSTVDISQVDIQSEITFVYVTKKDSIDVSDGIFGAKALEAGTVVGKIHFMKDNKLLAITDKNLQLIDTENHTSTLWNMAFSNQVTQFLPMGSDGFAIGFGEAFLNASENKDGLMEVYSLENQLLFSYRGPRGPSFLHFNHGSLLVGFDRQFYALNQKGQILWYYTVQGDENRLYQLSNQYVLFINQQENTLLKIKVNQEAARSE